MKKLICLSLVLTVLFFCMTACNFTQNVSGSIAGKAEFTPKVEEMMKALAEIRTDDAKALMHPQVAETSDQAIAQMSDYLEGREVSSMQLTNINVRTSTGTSGRTKQEQAAYRINLNDGTTIYINTVYFSDDTGAGFSSFQLVLGVV